MGGGRGVREAGEEGRWGGGFVSGASWGRTRTPSCLPCRVPPPIPLSPLPHSSSPPRSLHISPLPFTPSPPSSPNALSVPPLFICLSLSPFSSHRLFVYSLSNYPASRPIAYSRRAIRSSVPCFRATAPRPCPVPSPPAAAPAQSPSLLVGILGTFF